MLDINKIRADFPILSETVYGKPLVYFDNAATTQKPRSVVQKLRKDIINAMPIFIVAYFF
jgi:cysteine desulfurase/selenocysteine lyase